MTIWALALLATSLRAANVAPARTAAPSGGGVRAVPAVVVPSLGGGLGGVPTFGNIDLRGSLPTLPLPAPGLALPRANFVPPDALQYKRVDAQSAAVAPQAAAETRAAAAPAAPRRAAALLPEDPAAASPLSGVAGSRADERGGPAGLLPALTQAGAPLRAPTGAAAGEAALDAGRVLFDNGAQRPALDLSRFSEPLRPAPAARAGLLPRGAATSPAAARPLAAVETAGAAPASLAAPELACAPDAAPLAARQPLPDALVADATLRDAVASPRFLPLDAAAAGLRGGHAPLLARPDRLALAGEGLVVRVAPVPASSDALLRGRPAWTAPRVPEAPLRRLVSTDLIERGALLEAMSAADAAIGRGLLGLADGDIPGAMSGSGRPAALEPRRPGPAPFAPRPAPSALGWLVLVPLAAFAAVRRFL